jgi:predicted nucleotidyltransferase
MFEDDRGRLRLIEARLADISNGLSSSSEMADEILWWRLSLVEQSSARLSARYLDQHPEIKALGLPTLDQALNEAPPPVSFSVALARQTIRVFAPLLADPPLPPPPRPPSPSAASRHDEVVEKLQRMAPRLRARGITSLYLFGSVARREDKPESDVDIAFAVESDDPCAFSLLDQAGVATELSEALGSAVDFVELSEIRPNMRERMNQDLETVW